MLNRQKADGWMKAYKDKKEIIIEVENNTLLWVFCPSSSFNLTINDYSKAMMPYSLLTIKDFSQKTLTIMLSKAKPIIFGGIKYCN